jgi:hypothetical protein
MTLRRLARYVAARLGRSVRQDSAPTFGYTAVFAAGPGEDGHLTDSTRSRVEELTRLWLWCSCIAWSVVCLGVAALVGVLGAVWLVQRRCASAAPAESLLLGRQLCPPAEYEVLQLVGPHSRRSQSLGPGSRDFIRQSRHSASRPGDGPEVQYGGGGDGGPQPGRGTGASGAPSQGEGPQLIG